MNDVLQQLIGMGPGIGAAVGGNGVALQSFMQGYERARQRDEQRRRMGQQDQIAAEDRQRMIERQTTADTRATEDQSWQQQQRMMALVQQLQQSGAQAETLPEAEGAIDSTFGLLTPEQQTKLAPARDQSMIGAQRAITGRQKKQVEAYIDAALKTSFVADNPDADPELVQLPEHIARIVGKPSARLSELQQFAQLPVGKPAGKTRVPPASGSFEEYSDPSTPPERKAAIEADRKRYMQSDDKPTVNVTLPGGISGKAGDAALKFQDDYARDSKPYLTLRDAYQRVKSASAKPDAAGDLSMIFAYMKMLDPNSVVREQEFANAQNAAGVPDRIRNIYNKVMEGTRLAPDQRQQFVAQAEALFENAKTNQRGVRGTYGKRAKQWGIPETMVLDDEDEFLKAVAGGAAPAPAPSAGPKPGERRKAPDGSLVEWDGKGWKPVRF